MRRFLAYLVMMVTIVLSIAFNAQTIFFNKIDSMEYGYGTQLVYSLEKRDDTLYDPADYPDLKNNSSKDLSDIDISKLVMERLDKAGVRNADVSIVNGDKEHNTGYQLKVNVSTISDKELDNIKEILGRTGSLAIGTVNDLMVEYQAADKFFNDGTVAKIVYKGTTPYPTIQLKDGYNFDDLKKKAEEAGNSTSSDDSSASSTSVKNIANNFVKMADDTSSSDDSDSSTTESKNLILWMNKTKEDTYAKAFGTNDVKKVEEVSDKVLATLSIDNYDSDSNTITITTDKDGNAFDISSARAFVNMLNSDDYGFDITFLYQNNVPATLTSAGLDKTYLACGIALGVIALLLILVYGLSGLTASISLISSR